MRMKRAAQLLADKSISISEVAYKVGFGNNTNYFSTAFRMHFGKTPKEFQRS
jgi:AraC-like DNA-binding protein